MLSLQNNYNDLCFRSIKFNPLTYRGGSGKFGVSRACQETGDKIRKALFEGELREKLKQSPLDGDVYVTGASFIEKKNLLEMKLNITGHKGSVFYRDIKTPVDLTAEKNEMLPVQKLVTKITNLVDDRKTYKQIWRFLTSG